MSVATLLLLGGFELKLSSGAPVILPRRKAQALLAYLACHPGYRGWVYQSLGRASLLLGRLDEARRLGDRAVESSSRHPGFAAHALHLLGDVATHPDRFDAESGEAHYRDALALAEPRGMRPLVARCHLGLGRLYWSAGSGDEAQQHLALATAMAREMGMRIGPEAADAG